MASDWDYTYAVARIRVLETHLLSDNDVNSMIALKDEGAVLSYLKDKGWGDTAAGDDPDEILEYEEKKTWALMKELGVNFSVFNVLSFPSLYHNLKAAVKAVCTSDESGNAFYADDRYGREEMMRIVREKDFSVLPEHMRACASEAYETMLHSRDGQLCDIIIDRACLDAMEKEGKASRDRIISDYAESIVDVTNIKVAVRAAKTKKSIDFLYKALAPCRAFDVRQLAQAASSGEDALMDFLNTSGFSEAAEALKQSPSAFERWCDNQTIETIKPQKYQVCSVGPLVAYVLARQNEIKTARIILTCKANGLPEEEIRERTREMYV
jgi:V/A-type H+-transporting ATPase subunit C